MNIGRVDLRGISAVGAGVRRWISRGGGGDRSARATIDSLG